MRGLRISLARDPRIFLHCKKPTTGAAPQSRQPRRPSQQKGRAVTDQEGVGRDARPPRSRRMFKCLRRRRAATSIGRGWDLSAPLLDWNRADHLTLGQAVEGPLVLGATGSGKSTGSGRALALSFLSAGFGGLVLTAKPDERRVWDGYCRDTGREQDLIIFGPGGEARFNFLDHELIRKGDGAGLTENIVNLFSTVLEVAERGGGQGGGGREDEGYWRRANRQLCRNLVDLVALARGRIEVHDLYRALISAPTSREQIAAPQWRADSLCYACLLEAEKRPKTPRQEARLQPGRRLLPAGVPCAERQDAERDRQHVHLHDRRAESGRAAGALLHRHDGDPGDDRGRQDHPPGDRKSNRL